MMVEVLLFAALSAVFMLGWEAGKVRGRGDV